MMNALIILTPTISHYNASISMLKSLERLGYNTYVTVNDALESIIDKRGQNTCKLNSKPFGLDYDLFEYDTNLNPTSFLNERMNYKLFNLRKLELTNILENVKPSIVFIDVQNSTDFIVLYNLIKSLNIKIFFLQTTLNTKFLISNPNYNSSLRPRPLVKLLINNLTLILKYQAASYLEKIKFLGYDDNSIIKRLFKSEKINKKYNPYAIIPHGCMFNNMPIVYVCPKELEFTSKYLSGIYLGNSVVEKKFSCERNNFGCELLYISFGTINFHKTKVIENFLDSLNLVLAKKPNINAVLSCGLNYELFEKNKSRWDKLKLFSFVDQHEALSQCDYFISHGGLNSIKESIHYHVPMLIYPLEGDQIGNAQKIDFLGLGIAGNIYKDNLSEIGNKLEILISNKKELKFRLMTFNKEVKQNYNIDKILNDSIKNYKELE
jgi:hypothetical protein